ncbi:hypothetical protein PITC_014760 [Penicillium italicum]|uniref:Uncharacterized protein n=1 Tax=Penicillium italicum TaxID=40296 RepID=A0A0A2KU80_PENIT|nr:hypothetical protein PITC_014760 [Penicillium italicum]
MWVVWARPPPLRSTSAFRPARWAEARSLEPEISLKDIN